MSTPTMPACPRCGEQELGFFKSEVWCHACALRWQFDREVDLLAFLEYLLEQQQRTEQ